MLENIDLNAPAFGEGSQKIEDLKPKDDPALEPQSKEVVEKEEEPEAKTPEEGDEQRVPYSRFRNVHQQKQEAERRAEEAEKAAEEWRLQAEALRQTKPAEETKLPDYWVKLYGDSEESKEAWRVQQKMQDELKEEARREALEAVRNERYQEEARVNENLDTIDSRLETLSEYVGRALTEKEEAAVLDIVDEYTPQDEEGNYLGDTIPFEKAWEIYELKRQASESPKKASRDNVAAISAANSTGNSVVETEKDKAFNPLDWNAWKKRI